MSNIKLISKLKYQNPNNKKFLKKSRQDPIILALGAESAGNFSVYHVKYLQSKFNGVNFDNKIFFSKNFGDLLDEKNYKTFQKAVLDFLKENKIKPDIILTDLHPLYKTTIWGEKLAKIFNAKHIKIQHHLAHIFSSIGEKNFIINNQLKAISYKLKAVFGVACDGTGYGLDGKIWGGEVFQMQNVKIKNQNDNLKFKNNKIIIERIGHLENQIMIGGDLAIQEPARMLISILNKIPNSKFQNTKYKIQNTNLSQKLGFYEPEAELLEPKVNEEKKEFIYKYVKQFYTQNQFELLYNQLQQNFNCIETSSTGRILDAVSVLLGFCKNERNYKHEPIDLLEKNSTIPYKINSKFKIQNSKFILNTTFLFEYLIKNLHRDKKRLAATAQLYIAQGLYKIISNFQFPISNKIQNSKSKIQNKLPIFFGGGLANNKIISNYLKSKDAYVSKKIPRGDAGLSFGQLTYCILNDLDVKLNKI